MHYTIDTRIRALLVMVAVVLLFSPDARAQQEGRITGTITDSLSGQTIPGVNVVVVGTQQGASTGPDGEYTISGVEPGSHTLRASFVGYAPETRAVDVAAGETTEVNFTLAESGIALEDVVVTALGVEREERSLSYSTQQVSSAELTQAPELNVAASLAGEVAGLSVSQAGTGVGGEAKITLRGHRSITGSSEPLVVVDGVPIRGDISDISSYSINSIDVLKGPNAAALYGSEAQNGAIVITTQRAEVGEVGVRFNQNLMITDPIIPINFQNEYGQGAQGVYDPSSEGSWGPRMDGQMVDHWSPSLGEDVQYALAPQPDNVSNVFQRGYNSSTNVEARVGNELVQSVFSYTFTSAEGVVPNNRLERHSVQVNATTEPLDNLSVDGKLTYNREGIDNSIPTGSNPSNAVLHAYRMPRSIHTAHAEDFSYTDADGVARQNYWNPGTIGGGNPYFTLNRNLSDNTTNRIIAQGSATYDFTNLFDFADLLNLKVRGSIDNASIDREERLWYDTYTAAPRGRYTKGKEDDVVWYGDVLMSYMKEVGGNWTFDANVGGSIKYRNANTISSNTGNGLTIPNFFAISNTRNVESSESIGFRRRVRSLYGFGQIAWKDAVFLDVTGRNDWSSTLPPENNSFFYPSVGLSAVLTDLAPALVPDIISFAKLRGSWSQVGNSAPPFMTTRTAEFSAGGNNGFITISGTLPAEDLVPEETESFEVGTDVRTFNGRLGLDLTLYHTTTRNQLFTVELPAGTGAAQRFTNGGNVRNRGIESTLYATPIQSADFTWDLDVNWALNRSLVKEISDRRPSVTIGGSFIHDLRIEEGEPFGQIYTAGFRRDEQGRVIVGQGGVPLRTDGLSVMAGNINPDWEAGLGSSFSYKGVTFSFLIDHRQGGNMLSVTSARLDAAGVTQRSLLGREGDAVFGEDVFPEETAVTQEGEPNTIPFSPDNFWTRIGGRESAIGEAHVENATNTQLREAVLSYTFPESVVQGLGASNLTASLVGRNLFYLYKASDRLNPNFLTGTGAGAEGYAAFAPPLPRSVGFSLSLSY